MMNSLRSGLNSLTPGSINMKPTINIGASWNGYFVAVVALIMSWAVNDSIWWAILHVVFCLFYVPYWLIAYSGLPEWIAARVVM